ncbi:potassium channel family protein [Gilvimarinus agarilyticus]|uniref:potassium channel family protein n=1 Tax=unclassified Gilvimarinus TaxID=2642066 RepID=UPI001C080A1C|nr:MULTISPECIES: potassium channel family protein [unclassified Gilvimarinus]MBU2887165.1 potassium channel family protein [Gilvimarinus agarilyticus]MDO6571824.1 potassium channel family protein [Gilvimarinus sp. 2_MG-2023]MDO6745897.1 potassium channel family protein [Gilvimarinus sp. 1_MG-2023]
MRHSLGRLRVWLYFQLEPKAWGYGLSPFNWVICALIALSSTLAILETEPGVREGREALIHGLELVFSSVFLVEYIVRVWCCVENRHYRHPFKGRLAYLLSPAAVLDLLAVLPLLLGVVGPQTLLLRFVRLLRIVRLAKFGRFSRAVHRINVAVRSRGYELSISMIIALSFMVFASILLYFVEGDVQPEAFGSIPRALWWSVITFTTVGYGDVYPITHLGKVLAGLTAIAGIALVAMPTGILASAFSDAMQRGRFEEDEIKKKN